MLGIRAANYAVAMFCAPDECVVVDVDATILAGFDDAGFADVLSVHGWKMRWL